MTFVIRDTTIVTGDPARTVLYNAAIAIEDDHIAAVGPSQEVCMAFPDAEALDGRGKVVFPGLVNCHAHLVLTHGRGLLDDFGFPARLRFPVSLRGFLSSQEEVEAIALLGAVESIRSGATTIVEISSRVATYAPALARTGLRWVLAENICDVVDEMAWYGGVYQYSPDKMEAALQASVDLLEKWHGKERGRVTCFLAPWAPEMCSPNLLRRVREIAETYNTGYTIHLAQSTLEVEVVKNIRGVRPAHYLFHHDFLGPRLVAAHCRYLDDTEVSLMGATRSGVSHNAAIAARRGVLAPISKLQAAGCHVGLGSDNFTHDMVEVLRLALWGARMERRDEVNPQPEDALEWGTGGASRVLGMEKAIGSLEVGKKADLFIVDSKRSHLVPTLRIVSAFVHNGHPSDIEAVMVNGRWLMKGGKVLTVDESEVVARAEEVAHRAWKRALERFPSVPFPIRLPPGPL
ncbi:MAG: amidohydrolase family protein [Dehalococcoidia bacterium]